MITKIKTRVCVCLCVWGGLILSCGRESMTVTAIGFAVHALFAPLTAGHEQINQFRLGSPCLLNARRPLLHLLGLPAKPAIKALHRRAYFSC